jgi:hypothetical protein
MTSVMNQHKDHDDEHNADDEGNITEYTLWYCTTGRELT